jgi:hypothetical protein
MNGRNRNVCMDAFLPVVLAQQGLCSGKPSAAACGA